MCLALRHGVVVVHSDQGQEMGAAMAAMATAISKHVVTARVIVA